MKQYKESNILIAINTLKKIITIFMGPFLTAYFIKVSPSSLLDLSIYNIMNYFILGTFGIIVDWYIRNKFQIGMFRVGVITNFIYILTIIILKEKILNYLPLISFLFGFSAIAYYFPYNLFAASKISNNERKQYEFKKKTLSTITAIITPIILGGMITTTNYHLTAVIILFISLIQIILSFFLNPVEDKSYDFTPLKSCKRFLNNKNIKNIFIIDFLKGLNVEDGVLKVLLTVLIFEAFKTDLNLGILTSISYMLTIFIQYIYTKKLSKKEKIITWISSIIPVISLISLLVFTSNLTLTLYYFCYNTFINVLILITDIKLFTVSNCEIIKNGNEIEFWMIREVILNLGRIVGYIVLLIIALYDKFNYLYYYLLILTLSIIVLSYFTNKVKETSN